MGEGRRADYRDVRGVAVLIIFFELDDPSIKKKTKMRILFEKYENRLITAFMD